MKPGRLILLALAAAFASAGCNHVTDSNPVQLTANVVDPQTVNAVSLFNSCVGHPYPDPASPNSAKNYFWPNSTNFGTNDQLREYAACSGTITQTNNDTNDPSEFIRGQSVHLFCGHSSRDSRHRPAGRTRPTSTSPSTTGMTRERRTTSPVSTARRSRRGTCAA